MKKLVLSSILAIGLVWAMLLPAYSQIQPLEISERFLTVKKSTMEKILSQIKNLQTQNSQLQSEVKKLTASYEQVKRDNDKLRSDYNVLNYMYQSNLSQIKERDVTMEQQRSSLSEYAQNLEKYRIELEQWAKQQNSKPLTIIKDQTINWYVSDSKGNRYSWSLPMSSFETLVKTQPYETITLSNTDTGQTYVVRNSHMFVGTSFSNVIDEVYNNAKNNSDFIYEVWFIVSQLTTYSAELEDTPRWALETLTRGGGDCEDTAILIADMIKSSKHTKNWKIQLVYFDSDNPTSPKTINHVAVTVNDGKNNYIIESTSKDTPDKWPKGITGWYFPV